MSACKDIKDLILTDYIDSETSSETQKQIEGHLLICADCRRFAEEAQKTLVTPFKETERRLPPENLWYAIKEKLEGRGRRSCFSFCASGACRNNDS